MFNSTATKIFIGFFVIVLATGFFLAHHFIEHIQEIQSQNIDSLLSNRALVEAENIESRLANGQSIKSISDGLALSFVWEQSILGPEAKRFKLEDLKGLLPAKGNIVTDCQSADCPDCRCSFTKIASKQAWLIRAYPKSSIQKIYTDSIKEISGIIGVALLMALALAFIFARDSLKPLKTLEKVTQQIAGGKFESGQLPTARADEIGSLARSFQIMMGQLKQRERNLALTGMELAHSARLATVGQLGSSVAHEIKNPLTSMKGYARLLKDKVDDPELKEAAEIIGSEAERCNQILQQMLRFSRQDADEKKAFALKEVIESAMLLAKAEAKKKRIQLKFEEQDELIVEANAQRIQQVLLNLLVNAIHASPPSSEILILTYREPDFAVLEVKDQGDGIPEDVQDKIFDAFFTTKSESKGTGLGLSISSKIISEQGGKLEFESKTEVGTSFFIRLPRADA